MRLRAIGERKFYLTNVSNQILPVSNWILFSLNVPCENDLGGGGDGVGRWNGYRISIASP